MQTSDLINFINGNKDITQKDIDELVALVNKYPYFETFYKIILRGVKKIEKDNLEGIIQKFSIYIVDRKKMMNDLFLTEKKVIKNVETTNPNTIRENIISTDDLKNNKKTQKHSSDKEIAFYERQKKKHESVLRDFFVQRVKKMTKISDLILENIEKDTVDFRPNYDATAYEPSVMPATIPQLLLNGTMGIAVGMATNIPPHNLNEVVDATIHLLRNSEATIDDLLKFIKGPDFPTAAEIYDGGAVREMYHTGR